MFHITEISLDLESRKCYALASHRECHGNDGFVLVTQRVSW